MEKVLTEVFGIWYLIGAAFVFFMQAGFAMVEAGFTRAKNAGNIIMKNLMDFCLGTVAFLIIGYSLLMGHDFAGLIGWGESPLTNFAGTNWSSFTFNLVFCATAATIVSGAMAERTKFISYCIYSFVISLIVYPIEAHWVWGGGWLSSLGFHDFAGSAAIHYVGGLTALIGAWMLGPRIGKFDKDGTPRGISTSSLSKVFSLAGLVAITAGCDAVNVFGSFVIGILSGFVVCLLVWLLDYKLKVDDPVGAVAVHFGNGVLGTICVGLFACGTDTMPEAQGLFYGGGFHLLGVQLLGLLAIGAWTAVTMFITFFIIKKTVGLRVSAHEEIVGLDKMEHGLESAYAGFALEADVPGDYLETIQDSSYTPSADVDDAVPTKVIHSDGSISKVVIITKAEKFDKIKAALNEIGIGGMTVTKVSGCGVQKGQTSFYRGAKVNMELLPKLKVEVVVSEVPVSDVVTAAKKALYTGNIGDGKIFVYDVADVIRISTNARGKDALKYEE